MQHSNDPFLHFELERGVPPELAVGRGNALMVRGWCYHRRLRISRLAIRVGDREHRIRAHSMARPDVARAQRGALDPFNHSYRSGFWTVVSFPRQPVGLIELELEATLANGHRSSRPLGEIVLKPAADGEDPVPDRTDAPGEDALVAICMATEDPQRDLFHRQIESLRAQTHRNWVCILSDDSRPEHYRELEAQVAGDDRFRLFPSEGAIGPYHNFERALSLVPEEAELVALSDQGDRWYPEKLERLRGALEPRHSLVYADMRVVDPIGRELSGTYWTRRRTNHKNLVSAMVAPTMTASSALLPRRLLATALPFPIGVTETSPDRWLGMVALATGRVGYLAEPVQDHVRSDRSDGSGEGGWSPRPRALGAPRQAWRRWGLDYFQYVCALQLHAAILILRADQSLRGRRRRSVRLMRASERLVPSLLLASWLWLRARGARLRRASTMGVERFVATGLAWRRLARPTSRLRQLRAARR